MELTTELDTATDRIKEIIDVELRAVVSPIHCIGEDGYRVARLLREARALKAACPSIELPVDFFSTFERLVEIGDKLAALDADRREKVIVRSQRAKQSWEKLIAEVEAEVDSGCDPEPGSMHYQPE